MIEKITYTVLFVFIVCGALSAEEAFVLKKKNTTSHKQAVEKPDAEKIAAARLNRQMSSFVDSIIAFIPRRVRRPSVAIPAFDRLDDDRSQRNINFAFIDMLTSRLAGTKKYRLLDSDDVEDVQDDLDLDDNNLYGSKKEVLLGKKTKADFLIVGKLKSSKDETIELVTVKLIDVKSGSTVTEKTRRLERETLGEVTTDYLIESDSYDFLPPSLRFIFGMEYYHHITTTHFKDTAGDLGFNFGVTFDLYKRHSFQVLTSVIFSLADTFTYNNMTFEAPYDPSQTLLSKSTIRFTNSIEYQMGYGYIFRFFRMFYVRPSIFLGYSYMQYDYVHAGYNITESMFETPDLEYPAGGKLKKTDSTTSYYTNATVDVLINYNSQFSYFVSVGYKFMFNLFMDSWSEQMVGGYGYSGMYDAIMSGVTMRAGVSVYL